MNAATMWSTLSGRLGCMLALMFLVIGALLVGVSQRMPELRQLVELGAELVAASIAFALLAALLVFNLLTRRLHLLAREIEAFRASSFTQPRHLQWAHANGDEIDRLAFAFGEMCDHIARQIGELEQHDAQRRELLANVSHDLRTPLTLMQGYLETLLLRRGELSPAEERSCLEVAARHAERLGRLVADVFELTKLDGQAGRLQAETFSLTELAQDIAQKFELHANARRVCIRLALDASSAPVRGDIGMIERALENLVENALRHTPEGGRVGIETEGGPARVQVRVRDTGCGIARENLPHVFDRYFQAPRVELFPAQAAPDEADPAARHHAGLGLAITRRIVALHGGEIGVASRLGEGTVFSFDLPVAGTPGDGATSTIEPACATSAAARSEGLPSGALPDRAPTESPSSSRQLEEALQRSEERYVLAVRGANDGLWECDLAEQRMLLSPRWRHMFGLPDAADSMQVHEWRERLHPDDRQAAVEALEAHLRGETERYEHPHRLLHGDGHYRWVLSRGTALRRASGSPWRVVGLDTDITQLKRVECMIEAIANGTACQSGEAFFRSLVQHFAKALHVERAFITECTNRPPTRVRTLAHWRGGRFDADFEFDLRGTPCEPVIREGELRFHPRGLSQLFPGEVNQESYLGLPLFARDGHVVGHLAFFDRGPMPQDIVVESVYRIFTARAAVEIELKRALQRLRGPAAVAVAAG